MKLFDLGKKNKENLRPAKAVDADILVPRLIFIICVLVLILFGLVMIFSASNVEAINNEESPFYYLGKQILFCAIGVFAGFAVWRWIPFSKWTGGTLWFFFGLLIIAMLATLIGGTDILGARRWIYLGPVSFQPSEFAKIILVLIVAKFYTEYRNGKIDFWKACAIAGGISLGVLAFIYVLQNDMGSAVVCVVGILAVLWIAGFPIWFLITLIAVLVCAGAGAILVSGWRSNRFVFLDPYNDGAGGYGAGYQLIRSLYALSEGGLAGVGLGNSYEKYQYLPEAETDFIYSIVGEELGFIGCILVLAVFVVFLISGMMIVAKSKSRFAASISGAFITMIVFQALLNIFCVIGLAPTTGKPLPFISAGGSSLIATLVMVGFILAASETQSMPDEYEKRRSNFAVSGNAEEAAMMADEIIDAKIKRGFNRARTQARTGIEKNFNVKIPEVKMPKVNIPKFLDTSAKARPVKRTSANKPKPDFMKNVPSSSSQNKKNSYAYRRKNDMPSFKPRGSAFSDSNKTNSKGKKR